MLRGRGAGIAAALAVIAAAAVTAGCGGGGSALSLDPVAAAATKTQQAGAARIRLALTVSAPQEGKKLEVHGTGAVDGESSKLSLSAGSKSLEEISLEQNSDYVVYLHFAQLTALLPGGKQWVELDLSKLGKSAGLDLQSLLAGSQVQPGDLLSMLMAEGAKIQNLGPATVNGAATTHYRVTIDTAKALQAKGLTTPLLTGLAAQLPTIPADVWIGNDGLVHRTQLSLGVDQRQLDLTVDLYDYGANVDIAAPPSSDVFDATQFAQQGMLGGGHWSPYHK
jgi:hypothetical protein